MDIITIDRLRIDTIIGVRADERKNKQALMLTISLPCDAHRPAQHDNLRGALDYDVVVQKVTTFVAQSQFQLIETLAEKTAELILTTFKPEWVKLAVSKPKAIANAETVMLTIQRPS